MSTATLSDTGFGSWYAAQVMTAVQQQTGPLSSAERDMLYGALYAAAATGVEAMLDPAEANAAALAQMIRTGRNGPCSRCGATLLQHDLDLGAFPWLSCPSAPSAVDHRARVMAWLLWVAVPLLSLGILSWVPSLIAAVRERGRGWGVAAALLGLFTLSFWTQPEADVETRLALWLGAAVYGATQVRPWLRRAARADTA